MKKKIFSIAAALVAFVAINASAQNANTCNTPCTPDAKCQTTGICKKAKSECTSPFAGLNLTDAQQKAIKDLKKPTCKGDSEACRNLKADCKAKKAEYKAKKAELKAQRAKNISAARTEYLAKLKTILTPQQYQQFLENNFVNGTPRHDKHGFKHGKHHGKKGDFKGQKRNCKQSNCPKTDANK